MNLVFKCLVAVILILCIISATTVVAYYATTYREQMEAHDDITSEGPNCRTVKWYVMDAVARFDGMLCEWCKAVGNDSLLVAWRTWLKVQYNVTMY